MCGGLLGQPREMNAPARIGIVINPKLQTGMTRHLLKGTQAGSGSNLGLPSGAQGLTHPAALPLHTAWHARVSRLNGEMHPAGGSAAGIVQSETRLSSSGICGNLSNGNSEQK